MNSQESQPGFDNQLDRRALIAGIGGLAAGAALFTRDAMAGPLAPPPGPISSTGRTVQEIYDKIARTDVGLAEPRIPVQSLPGSATALHVIEQPGSYYLTGNIQGESGKNGIEIRSDNVVLDLAGHTITGGPGVLAAIVTVPYPPTTGGVVVRNGIIHSWAKGVDCRSRTGIIENLLVRFISDTGILGWGASICNCHVDNAGSGIFGEATCLIRNCTTRFCGTGIVALGSKVLDCVVLASGSAGVQLVFGSRCEGCEVLDSGTGVFGFGGARVVGCTFKFCGWALDLREGSHLVDGNTHRGTNGIQIQGEGGTIIRNMMQTSGTAYDIAPGNAHGPIVNVAGVGDITSVPGADHPWANFIY